MTFERRQTPLELGESRLFPPRRPGHGAQRRASGHTVHGGRLCSTERIGLEGSGSKCAHAQERHTKRQLRWHLEKACGAGNIVCYKEPQQLWGLKGPNEGSPNFAFLSPQPPALHKELEYVFEKIKGYKCGFGRLRHIQGETLEARPLSSKLLETAFLILAGRSRKQHTQIP